MKIVKSNNLKDAEIGAVKLITPNSFDDNYVIITPDRYSLNLEKNIFEILNVESLFNVSVMGISRFAKKVLSECEDIKESVSSLGTLILVRQAIINMQSKLNCFKNVNFGLCEEITNTISLLKSSGIKPEEKVEVKSENLKAKLQDVFLIYNEYEKLLNGRLDSSALLDELEEKVNLINLKKTTVMFIGFDSLTKQGLAILSKINECAKEVVVSIVEPFLQANSYIYEHDLWEKVVKIGKDIRALEIPCSLNETSKHILENLFAFKPVVKESENIRIYCALDVESEVLMLARKIKKLLTLGYRFKDIAVGVGGLEKYSPYIERIFNKHNFSYYIDESVSMIDLFPIKFIFTILNLFLNKFKKEDIIEYILSPFCEIENKDEKIREIIKYDINEDENYVKNNFEKLFQLMETSKKIKNNIEFLENILKIYNFEEKITKYSNDFSLKGMLKNEKIFLQLNEKMKNIIEILKNYNVEESLENFIKILETAFAGLKISTVPATVDCVVVSDATSGFFQTVPFLFIVGADENLPKYIADCGVITDKDISQIKIKNQIEPTVRMINRRNKFKLLSTFTAFKNMLIVSYPQISTKENQNQPSSVVVSLKNIFCFNNKPLKTLKEEYIYTGEDKEKEAKYLAYLSIDGKEIPSLEEFNSGVVASFKQTFEKEIKEESTLPSILHDSIKVTELETYFSCPFKRFATYNLKLKERESSDLSPADIGNFVHAFLEKIIFNLDKVNIVKTLEALFTKEKFYKFNLAKNKANKEILIKEMKNLAEFLISTQNHTDFKPVYCEKKVNHKISTNLKDYNLIGVIDRIDTFKDYFRIIDYKTGGKDLGGYSELYYGEKLQLFLYLKSAEEELKLKPCGVFYLKVKNNEENQKLNGFYLDEFEVLRALDTTLNFEHPASDLVKSLKIKTNKENREQGIIEYYSNGVSEKVFKNLEKYAQDISRNAIIELENKNITPNPMENACAYCPYGALCKFSVKQSFRNKEYKIDKKFFGGGEDD